MTVNQLKRLLDTHAPNGDSEVKFMAEPGGEELEILDGLWFTYPKPSGAVVLWGEAVREYNLDVLGEEK
jgi:hypothetical protein